MVEPIIYTKKATKETQVQRNSFCQTIIFCFGLFNHKQLI